MKYEELKEYFHKFRMNQISKIELGVAIYIWQMRLVNWNVVSK